MSSKARRLTGGVAVQPFNWLRPALAESAGASAAVDAERLPLPPMAEPEPVAFSQQEIDMRLHALEREAFAKGYAQGERAGEHAAAERGERLVRNLAATLDEIASIRAGMLRKTERDVVRLSIAIAERVIHREVSIDRELLLAMARVAVDRLGERVQATVHLNPVDHAATAAASNRSEDVPSCVALVADPLVARGGCIVRTEFGSVDLTLDAQMAELTRSLLGPEPSDTQSDRIPAVTLPINDVVRDRPVAAPPAKLEPRAHKSVLTPPPGLSEISSVARATA
jgi:flagellar assembly protein FliH